MQVTKRDGSKENFNPEKINKVIEWACEGLSGVSASDVAMKADIQLYNNIKTKDIHEIVIRAAGDLISVEHPDYQHVAGRLALFNLVKEVHGHFDYPDLEELIKQNVKRGVYDPSILDWYTSEDMAALNKAIKHDRNWNFTYAGLQQLIDKYLVRNRVSGELYETPQFLYMCMAMCIFHNYPKEHRLELVARFYDAISTSKINLPTPIMGGLRTPLRQYASCTLIDIDDDLSSIFSSDHAIGLYTAQRSGIGGNAGRIRAIGSKIRHGEVEHTGAIPFLKKFEATVQCCTQNGIRGGSATIHYPFWHYEIEDILVLKNNKGTEENRVRKLDYSIQFCKLFYERYIRGETVTLFSPNDVPGLYDAFGTQDFDELYRKYERAPGIRKKKVDARELLLKYAAERIGTGRVYMMNADHVNTHSSFIDHIFMSNLCQEITLPTKPIYSIDDENGEIALCILSAINIGAIKDLSEMEELCELAIRALDALIDYQEYPVIAAELSTKRRRSLGIGFTNVAYYLAKHKVKYTDPEAAELMDEATEALQYWCLKAGVKMAKEKGACEYFHRTKYSQGVLPIDTYKKEMDIYVKREPTYDWEALREEIKEYGLRNSTYTAFMPSESSSVVSNATQGIDPIRELITTKISKKGPLKQVVPDVKRYGKYYQSAWKMGDNKGYLKVCGAIQKWADQGISVNQWFVFDDYENGELPVEIVIEELLLAYQLGLKNLYYLNTDDGSGDESVVDSCASGACAI